MPFKYLGKALAAISQTSADKVDAAAARISAMSWEQISSLNSRLDMGWLRMKISNDHLMRGAGSDAEQRADLADFRRGALLAQELAGLRPDATFENGRSTILNTTIPASTVTGFYLKASAWAFASHTECNLLMTHWNEALMMAANARLTAGAALYSADNACRALVTKWFGAGNPLKVVRVLEDVCIGANTRLCGICYEGHGVGEMARWRVKLQENSYNQFPRVVNYNLQDYGWSAPTSAMHQSIGFTHKFFDQHCKGTMLRPHITQTLEMNCTRGGAMLHEMTHRFARTEDVTVPRPLIARINANLLAAGITVRTVSDPLLGYGPPVCAMLASEAPELALNNADSYRLFAEDAFYAKPFS